MAVIHRTTATLRFFGDDLVPAEVTRLLGGEPTDAALKGEPRVFSNGRSIITKTGRWLRKTPDCEPGNLAEQIRLLISGLTEDLTIWRKLSAQFEGNVFVGFFMAESNEGYSLSPEILTLLTDRGLALWLDVYGPIGSSEDAP